ncbi:MAG: hypothetical protein HOM80_02490, partial [Bacteroidetes bacterium]|nr:hypothetical protein [Bacteroidota bacterium]
MKIIKSLVLVSILSFLSLSTYATLSKPTILYPANGSTSFYPAISVGLSKISGVTLYRFQFDTSSNFNSSLLIDSSRTSQYSSSHIFPIRSTVYVRLKVYSASDSSDWSDVHSIYISDVLRLAYPKDETTGPFDYLGWYNVNAQNYKLLIDTSSSFNSPMLYEKNYANLSIPKVKWDSFYFNQKYYWKVEAYVNGDTMLSDTWSFTHQVASKILFPPFGQNWGGRTGTVAMKWEKAGMAKVEYQISTDPSFSTIDRQAMVSSYENDWDTAFLMNWDTRYYSRIRFLTAVETLAWDMGGNQRTLLPRFTDPYNGKTIDFTGVWTKFYGDSYGVDTFQFQIDTNTAFSNPLLDTLMTGLNYRFIPERLATTYYLRVRGVHANDTSVWNMRYVKTADINYYGLYSIPQDKSTDTDLELDLRFSGLINGIPYLEIEMDTTPLLNSPLHKTFTGDYITSTPVKLSDLQFGTTYHWRFKIGDQYDTSEWSAMRTFTTWGSPIKYDYPPNTARNWHIQNNLLIKKPSAKGIKYYVWELDTTSLFNSPVLKSGKDTIDLEFSPDGYFYLGQEYYWHVAAAHSKDTSEWGPTWNYQTHTTYLNKPLNGAIDQNTSVKLEWGGHSDLQGYFVLIDTSMNFNSAWIKIADGFQQNYTINNLINGATYYWTIRPYNEIDTGDAYEVYSFTVKDIPALTKPQLYLPNNFASNLDYNSVYFSWKSYPETGVTYNIQIASSSNFSNLLYDKNQSNTNVTVTGFTDNTTYYWRVRYRRSSVDLGPWSSTFHFTTKQKPSAIENQLAAGYLIYPNPVNDVLFIQLPQTTLVSIINSSGQSINSYELHEGLNKVDLNNLA